MGTVYKKTFTKPLPENAELFARKGERFARWKPQRGRTRTAAVTEGLDGSLRIVVPARTYTAKYRDGTGRVREKATGCRDEGAARSVLAELERRAELVRAGVLSPKEDSISDQSTCLLKDHIGEYLAYLKAKGSTKTHQRDRRRYLDQIMKDCRFERIRDLDRNTLERLLYKQLEDGVSARTANALRAAAIAFANWCVRTQRLAVNPFEGIPKANEENRPTPEATRSHRGRTASAHRNREDSATSGRFEGESRSAKRPDRSQGKA